MRQALRQSRQTVRYPAFWRKASSACPGVLITGIYGTGKSSVVEEIAEILEDAGISYGAIDLDWLLWFDAEVDDAGREQVFLASLAAVVGNDRPVSETALEVVEWLGWPLPA